MSAQVKKETNETPKNDETRSVTLAGHEGLGAGYETGECLDKSNTADAQDDQLDIDHDEIRPATITIFSNADNKPLSKTIELIDGKPQSISSVNTMSRGTAERCTVQDVRALAALINRLGSHQALSIGVPKDGIKDGVTIVSKAEIEKRSALRADLITRSLDYFEFVPDQRAVMLLDYDMKAMPVEVSARIAAMGGFIGAISHVIKGFEDVGYVIRRSTSAGLYNLENGEEYQGSGGLHVYIFVRDGTDIRRALLSLHERAWLSGLGWIYVTEDGKMLDRSIVDKFVGSPERLAFEGMPTLVPPLAQRGREAIPHDGCDFDTLAYVPSLSVHERAEFDRRVSDARRVLEPIANEKRKGAVERQVHRDVARGMDETRARRNAEAAYGTGKVLTPTHTLYLDDGRVVSVGDILADGDAFIGEKLADPLESHYENGRINKNRAFVCRGQHGDILIRSSLHGGLKYALCHDIESLKGIIENTDASNVVDEFIRAIVASSATTPVPETTLGPLYDLVHAKTKCGKLALKKEVKSALAVRDNNRRSVIHTQTDWASPSSYAADNRSEPPWKDVDKIGEPTATWANACVAIDALGLKLRFDEFKRQNYLTGRVNGAELVDVQITEPLIRNVRTDIYDRFGFDAGEKTVYEALAARAAKNAHHPVKDYLSGLTWDGTARLDTWLVRYMGAEPSVLNETIGALVLIAAVRRIYEPGCKFDTAIMFQGRQGKGRSEAIQILFSEKWYSDTQVLDRSDKEVMENLAGIWGQELAEFVGGNKAEVNHTRALISRTHDKGRPAFGREVISQPRTCVFFGTINEKEFLRDPTGNRRFWPVRTSDATVVDKEALRRDRDQLWAEAVVRNNARPSLILDEELWSAAAAEQNAHRIKDSWEETLEGLIYAEFREGGSSIISLEGRGFYRVSSNDIVSDVLGYEPNRGRNHSSVRLRQVMNLLGWSGPQNRSIRGASRSCYEKHEATVVAEYANNLLVVLCDAVEKKRGVSAIIEEDRLHEASMLDDAIESFRKTIDVAFEAGRVAAEAAYAVSDLRKRSDEGKLKGRALEVANRMLREKNDAFDNALKPACDALAALLSSAEKLRETCDASRIAFEESHISARGDDNAAVRLKKLLVLKGAGERPFAHVPF